MIDYILAETVKLPSEGLIYDFPVNPEVKLKSMTTDHEMLRLNPSGERTYKNMADIIDDCIVGGIESLGCSSYDLCIGDFQFLMYKLRIITHGNEYEVSSQCPLCKQESDSTIDLDSLQISTYSDELMQYLEFALPVTNHTIQLKPQTPRMYDDAKIKALDMKRKYPNYTGDFQLLTNMMSMIKTVDSKALYGSELENFIRNLPLKDSNLIVGYADKITEAIGYTNRIWQVCPVCGYNYASNFRITGAFFRPRV